MSGRDVADTLEQLGLSRYEARVFVALQELGGGTAQDVADVSDVPRSQVYGAADDLADRGLVEQVEASPKRYRPVSLEAAREQLTSRIERQTERAFEELSEVRGDRSDRGGDGVATLRGRHPIDDRVVELLGRADSLVVYVVPGAWAVDGEIGERLAGLADEGVWVTLVSEDPEVEDRFDDALVETYVVDGDQMGEMTGRTLMVDDATVLLSVVEDEGSETALWTADTSIGRILAEFVNSGMEAGLQDQ